jgi:ABC-type Na+ efflux pump permease subunit
LGSARFVVARRDLSALSREKTIVLALLIQLFVAAFSSFLVVGLASLYDPSAVSGQDVEIGVTGNASDAVVAAANDRDGPSVERYATADEASRAFERDRVQAVLVANHEGPDRRIAVRATVPEGSLRTTLVVTQVRETLEALERQERQRRAEHLANRVLDLPPTVAASPYFAFTYTVLLPLLLFLPVFISGSIAVDAITEEVERGTLELLRVAPVSFVAILDGKAGAAIALAPAQAALWLGLLAVNGITVRNPVALLVLVSALTTGFVALALALSLVVPSRQRAQLLYSTAILLAFGGATALPEHPATTVARLAVGSLGSLTHAFVAGYVVLGALLLLGMRRAARRVDPEAL